MQSSEETEKNVEGHNVIATMEVHRSHAMKGVPEATQKQLQRSLSDALRF